ncbi:hypothetical protein PILCRDRAFT_384410 [Piloderma croceum F 1598]|uniref:Uncharacterized protein n=1 Tax=Piloderma croceum (strain F 1598) TaxID=765440 RepID=A0A0C3G173_PILCF|nr:hypothetical protein PILCRDRAFT_384410 [Piloderma croceum F 1598]
MNKLEVLVKIGDEVTKIHPYVNLAWKVLSAGMKMVQAQQARDQQILGLLTAMENTYSFVVSADELKSHPVLQDIIEQILKQTIECGYFIQEYTQRNFAVIVDPFSNVGDQTAAFCAVFAGLRKEFDSRVSPDTALVLSRTVSSVDMMARNQVPDTLRPFSTTNRSSMIDNGIPQRMDAKGWKEKGNELFKAGKFNDAISAYGTGLSSCSDLHPLAELLRNRSAAYLKTGSYQSARQDA